MIHYCQGEFSREGVRLDPASPAFRYGAGFFETICYNGRKVCHLDAHLDRLLHSLRAYGVEHETVNFAEVIDQVIDRNGLKGDPARVNIFYPVETEVAHPVVLATPYESKPYKAYRICLCNDRHVSVLNGQKTTSYMFFYLAMKQAKARGFDDAALLDFDNNLLETTTAALVLKRNGDFYMMDSPYRLRSTALAMAEEMLDLQPKVINVDELGEFRHAYMLNSLIGMRPVVAIGETTFVPDEDSCRDVTAMILEDDL